MSEGIEYMFEDEANGIAGYYAPTSRKSRVITLARSLSTFCTITSSGSRMGYALADREMRSVEQVRIVRRAGLPAG
jgi:hypothetical protein